jgi:hypothetical protein
MMRLMLRIRIYLSQIKKSAEKGQQFKTYADRVDQVATISKEGSDFVNGIKSFLVENSGGYQVMKEQLKSPS